MSLSGEAMSRVDWRTRLWGTPERVQAAFQRQFGGSQEGAPVGSGELVQRLVMGVGDPYLATHGDKLRQSATDVKGLN